MYTKSAVFFAILMFFSMILSAEPVFGGDPNSVAAGQQGKSEGTRFSFDFDDTSDGSGGSLVKQFFYAILMVILLGAASFYVTKKLAPKLAGAQGRQIKVIETVSIGSRRNIHLVEVGENKKVLVGSTAHQITLLTEIYPSLEENEK